MSMASCDSGSFIDKKELISIDSEAEQIADEQYEKTGILTNDRDTEQEDPNNVSKRVHFATTSNAKHQGSSRMDVLFPDLYCPEYNDTGHTISELTASSDQLHSASPVFTDCSRHTIPQLEISVSREVAEELKTVPKAVLYFIPKEKRKLVWIFLHGYVGWLSITAPCAMLVVDATSDLFEGCMLTVLIWHKYGLDGMLWNNPRRKFDGQSVSSPILS
jgi:hypothetical protein